MTVHQGQHAQSIDERSLAWRAQTELGYLYGRLKRHSEAEIAYAGVRSLVEILADTVPDEALWDSFYRKAIGRLDGSDVWHA
jgi:hypothetical protein